MTVEENTAISRRFVEEVWGRGNRDVAREIVAEHVIHHRRRRTEATGIEGLFQGLTMYDQAFPERNFTQEDTVAEGSFVADRWQMSAVHKGELLGVPPTNKLISLTGMNRYLIEDGKIVEIWHDEDIQGLMTQLGAAPRPVGGGAGQPSGGSNWPPPSGDTYRLPGPQVEPDASFWTIQPCPVPAVVRISDLIARTDDPNHPWYFPPYPDEETTAQDIEELLELASLRDDPAALAGRGAPAPARHQPVPPATPAAVWRRLQPRA